MTNCPSLSSVTPPIFASSLLYIPTLAVNLSGSTAGWAQWIATNLSKVEHPVYMLLYAGLIIFFTMAGIGILGAVAVVVLAVLAYFYFSFSALIDARLNGERERTLPRVYARPVELRRGLYNTSTHFYRNDLN